MKRRIISLLTLVCLLLGSVPFSLSASAAGLEVLTYEIADGEVTITGCDKSTSGEVVIPGTIGGYPVKRIGEEAFLLCKNLTSITIPSGVIIIEKRAFPGCFSLTNITIPDSVTSIGEQAFYACLSLADLTIPSGVINIGPAAFEECNSLSRVTIADGVTNIGIAAFVNCKSIEEIYIPASVISIGYDAFFGCSSLTNIEVDENNTKYSSNDGVLFDKNKKTLIKYPEGKRKTTYNVPSSVKIIKKYAFNSCKKLENIIIPESVINIGDGAFYWCKNLMNIFYTGTEGDWDSITVGEDNECLTNATIHYSYKFGDVSGDGEIDVKDVILIRQYIAGGYCVAVNESVMDTNKDGTVDARDIITLRKYIAGGYGVEL